MTTSLSTPPQPGAKAAIAIKAIGTRRTVEDWRRIIADDLSHAVAGIIAAGQHLREAKDEVEHGEWLPLLKTLKLGERTAQMLMKIAANEVLANPNHWFAFPMSWTTLHALATLDPKLLEAKIVDGTITPEIERRDVAALKAPAAADDDNVIDDEHPPMGEEEPEEDALAVPVNDGDRGEDTHAPMDPERMRRLEIENEGLKSEVEELKLERDRLRERVAELEAKLAGAAQAEKPKRGRPKGSKNKPKPPVSSVVSGDVLGNDSGPIPDFLDRTKAARAEVAA
jgi:hypothetical protein